MRSTFSVLFVLLAVCGGPGTSTRPGWADDNAYPSSLPGRRLTSAARPPPPQGFSGLVLRIEFFFPDTRRLHIGTGFIVQDRKKEKYLMTCAHLIDDKDWKRCYRLCMRTMKGDRRIESYGSHLHVGRPVDLKQHGANGQPDMTTDLVIRPAAGSWARPLPLADDDPRVGDWVWAVGCESHARPTDEKLFLGKIIEVAEGGYTMRKVVNFDPRGFSGGPVVNQKGEVVGNVLAGSNTIVSGATVSTLKRRLKENGVSLD
jgi:S1-C subfamily serine protease